MWWAGGTFKLWKELEKESGSGSGSGGGHINACGTPRVSGAWWGCKCKWKSKLELHGCGS
jgi:hypothetical protein